MEKSGIFAVRLPPRGFSDTHDASPGLLGGSCFIPLGLCFEDAQPMKATVFLPAVLLCGFLLGPAASATEDKKAAKSETFEVKTIKNISYNDARDADKNKHKLDLYLPKDQKDFPVLFFVHGGAWRAGDRSRYGNFGRCLPSTASAP
jgi:hypothetical protein